MTKTHVICKDCGNDFTTIKDVKAKKLHDRPKCKCGSRKCKEVKK